MKDNQKWMLESGFCDRLRQAREAKKLSMSRVACELGTVLEYMYKVENGKTCPSIARVMELAEIYGVGIDWLCGRKEA